MTLRDQVMAIIRGIKDPGTAADLILTLVPKALGRMGGRPLKSGDDGHQQSRHQKGLETPSQPLLAISSSGSDLDPSASEADPDPDLSKQDPVRRDRESNVKTPFDEFWEKYPKRVGKAEARRAWERRKPPLPKCLETLAWQVKSSQWQAGYIPNPATWINQGRWEDEPMAANGHSTREIRGMEAAALFVEDGNARRR